MKKAEMKRLVDEFDKASNESVAAMFCMTEESATAFENMWNYARENGFVSEYGTISI